MGSKLLVSIAVLLFSMVGIAQVQPAARRPAHNISLGAGMDYWSGDWGGGDINRWGPSAWATLIVWRGLGINAEGHSMVLGGNSAASSYKYFVGEGGLFYINDHWKVLQPFVKAELGFGSLSHPENGTGQLHQTSNTWAFGGGVELHTWRQLWTRADYTYDSFANFHSTSTGQYHTLNPRGLTFGETIRF